MVDLIFKVLHVCFIYYVVWKILYIHSLMIRRKFFIWTFQLCSAVGVPWELPSLNRVWASCQDTSGLRT